MELTLYHWLIAVAFIGVVIWVFSRKRKARFEKDSRIPLEDEQDRKG
jgi:cytochrome c oxidase cbb3-type subunit IV